MLLLFLAELSRLSQDDITQITAAVASFIWPPLLPGTELWLLSLSLANLLQVLGCLLSSKAGSSSLVSTLPSLTTFQSRPGTKFIIGTLGRIYHVHILGGRHIPKSCVVSHRPCDL